MQKNYIVKTHGLIIDEKQKNYVIPAQSLEEAKEEAENRFKSEYVVAENKIKFDIEQRKSGFLLLSIVGFVISVFLIYRNWYSGHEVVSMAPNMITVLYGVLFYSSFIVRFKGLERTFLSIPDLIVCPLLIIVISSIFQIILYSPNIKFLGIFEMTVDPNLLICVSLILSWLGLKLVSCMCYILIGIFALSNLSAFSNAMGNIWGPVFILTSYISICIYVASDPMLKYLIPELISSLNKGTSYLKNDFNQGKEEVKEIKKNISDIFVK